MTIEEINKLSPRALKKEIIACERLGWDKQGKEAQKKLNAYEELNCKVGDGATVFFVSDRCAYTVIERRSAGVIVIQRDKAIRTDNNGMSELQAYDFERNPNGQKIVCRWSYRHNSYMCSDVYQGTLVRIGVRMEYYDFSF